MKVLHWVGTSLDDLKAFPKNARSEAGHDIRRVQSGLDPRDWKPMKSIGAGAREIRVRDQAGAFRVFYVVVRGDAMYVLHAFQKKTQKTEKRDIDLAKARFKIIE